MQEQEQVFESQKERNEKQIIREIIIRCSDVAGEDECKIVALSNSKLQQALAGPQLPDTQKFSKVAGAIKKELDAHFGNGWYVICGKNYGSFVTHAKTSFMHFSIHDIHFTVFRTR